VREARSFAGGEAVFAAASPAVEEAIRVVTSRRRCRPEEAEELASAAHLRVVEDDYRLLRLHEGRSSLRTYLVVVFDRLLLDLRRRRWGVWRPSMEARRLGPVAVRLDEMLHRDGTSVGEAVQRLRTNEGVGLGEAELHELAGRLPPRVRRREKGEEELATLSIPAETVEEAALAWHREGRRRRLRGALRRALGSLSDEDVLILRLRFGQGATAGRIALVLGLPAKPLYRRIEGLLRRLREVLEGDGFDETEAAELIEHSAWDDEAEVQP
jgi:RNA polymerase sigma factor (sigma-70 family)